MADGTSSISTASSESGAEDISIATIDLFFKPERSPSPVDIGIPLVLSAPLLVPELEPETTNPLPLPVSTSPSKRPGLMRISSSYRSFKALTKKTALKVITPPRQVLNSLHNGYAGLRSPTKRNPRGDDQDKENMV